MAISHEKMLEFIHKQTKLGLAAIPHFDTGGTVATPTSPTTLTASGPGVTTNQNTNQNSGLNTALGIGNNFMAGAADTQAGTNINQLNTAYNDTQSALNNQSNQAAVLAPQTNTAVNAQNTLSADLMGQVNGTGPNPAAAQLNQATGQNIAQQAALAAASRGGGTNAGLIAEQNAQQGAATQQNAVGQAATLNAQQQIAAENNLANLSNAQIGQASAANTNLSQAEQGEQNTLQNANTAYNNGAITMQGNINNVNAQTATANQNSTTGLIGGLLGGASSIASSLFADGGYVTADDSTPPSPTIAAPNAPSQPQKTKGAMPSPAMASQFIPSSSAGAAADSTAGAADAGVSSAVDASTAGITGAAAAGGADAVAAIGDAAPEIAEGVGDAIALAANGGQIRLPNYKLHLKKYAVGGQIQANPLITSGISSGPQSFAGQWLNSSSSNTSSPQIASPSTVSNSNSMNQGMQTGSQVGTAIGKAIKNNQPSSPYNQSNSPNTAAQNATINQIQSAPDFADSSDQMAGGSDAVDFGNAELSAFGGKIHKELRAKGGKVKASDKSQQAVKKDNSYSNDKVPALLSEGEIVLPRSITMHPMAPEKAAEFVRQVQAKKGLTPLVKRKR